MHKFSIVAAIFGVSFSSAHAGSLETVDIHPDSLVAARSVNWSGAYVGAFGAYDFGSINTNDISSLALNPRFQIVNIPISGLAGGVLAGYNWQRGNIVFGLEADYSLGTATGSSIVDIIDEDELLDWKSNWSASVRARVGYVKNSWLFYGTAGISKLNADTGYFRYTDATQTTIVDDGRVATDYTGWSAGLGVEKKIGAHLVVRGEFIQSGYSEVVIPFLGNSVPTGYAPSTSTVRAAVIWSF